MLTDAELIDIPLANLPPGELSRAFRVKADNSRQEQNHNADINEARLTRDQRREEGDEQTRQDELLRKIHIREEELLQEAEEMDARTIRLADGRRTYVDGNQYRDETGRVLEGSDRAQAEQGHLAHPNAATWKEKQQLNSQWEAMETMRKKAEKGGTDLTAAENDFNADADSRKAEIKAAPEYNANYSDLGLSGNFTNKASGKIAVSAETTPSIKPQAYKP